MSAGTPKKILVMIVTVIFTSLLSGSTISATTLVRKDMDDLIIEADQIVLGTVLGKDSEWSVNYLQNRSLIYTTYTVQVEQMVKGTPHPTVQFRCVGGETDSGVLVVPSAPHFEVGERVVLFLRSRIPDAVCDVVGFEQGRFTVKDNVIIENGMDLDDFLAFVSNGLDR